MRLDFKCGGTVIEKRIARWSDKVGSVDETEERIVDVDRVIRRSRVWPWEWVGKLMCWVREKSCRRLMNWDEGFVWGWSTWMLKSPVMISSELEVARSSRREEKWEMKSGKEEEGGR